MSLDSGKSKSRKMLDEARRRAQGKKVVKVEEETVKLVIFRLLGDYFAVFGQATKEILPNMEINYVPGSPDFIQGIINVRGDIESVVSLNGFIGLPVEETAIESGRIIIISSDDVRTGILVDSVEDVLDVPVSTIKPPISTLSETLKEVVAGEYTYGDNSVTVLNIQNLLGKISV